MCFWLQRHIQEVVLTEHVNLISWPTYTCPYFLTQSLVTVIFSTTKNHHNIAYNTCLRRQAIILRNKNSIYYLCPVKWDMVRRGVGGVLLHVFPLIKEMKQKKKKTNSLWVWTIRSPHLVPNLFFQSSEQHKEKLDSLPHSKLSEDRNLRDVVRKKIVCFVSHLC